MRLLSVCFLLYTSMVQAQIPTVWQALRQEFSLSHEVDRPEVQAQLRWLIAHPGFIQTACRQSQPYIYHVLAEIKKRNLPGELALLPMIESAYNPFAYSSKGAAGLWQLMPRTASGLGLIQDWWFDGRRSIPSSTNAALHYLLQLNTLFNNNWLFAIASYDAGPGAVTRAIKPLQDARQIPSFWNVHLPEETRIYVPRFLALAELMHHPERYHITLPNIPYLPYFKEVNIGSQIDLNQAAQLAGMPYKDFIQLNPGFNRWATAPYQPFNLLIPNEKVADFNQHLARLPVSQRVHWIKHRVKNGENLAHIALRYHTTVNLIKQLNQLASNSLHLDQALLIPSSINPPQTMLLTKASPLKPHLVNTRPFRIIHIVQLGDTFDLLKKIYGVSTQDIQTWNKLAQGKLVEGQPLLIFKTKIPARGRQQTIR